MAQQIRYIAKILFTAAVYFILARLSLQLQFHSSNATPVWPPSGFAFAMMVLWGMRITPGILIGAFAANMAVFLSNHTCSVGTASLASLFIAFGNSIETIVGYFLLKRFVPRIRTNFFKHSRNVYVFLGIGIMMCLFAATIGVNTVYAAHIITIEQYWKVWLTWWLGDLSGILLVTPFILIWLLIPGMFAFMISGNWRDKLEVTTLFVITGLSSGLIFDDWLFSVPFLRWAFWMIPVLIWAAIRFDQRITVTAIVLCSIIAVKGTVAGHGPFGVSTLNDALLTLQGFIGIAAITTLTLNAAIAQLKETELMLREAGNQLEERVQERTAELAKATSQLIDQNTSLEKMNAELKSFSYIASHDLQEPLRKIQTISKRILEKEEAALSETGKDYFKRLHLAAYRMQTLIDDLLTYSRTNLEEKKFETIHLKKIIEEVREDFHELMQQKSARIETNELCEVKVIPFQFHQLMHNLVSNSLKFSGADRNPHIIIESKLGNGSHLEPTDIFFHKKFCHITVKDNGIGFEAMHSERIFEIFQRLHNPQDYPGTGVGLAICKKIVENHHGKISAESELGVGTTFHISIPV